MEISIIGLVITSLIILIYIMYKIYKIIKDENSLKIERYGVVLFILGIIFSISFLVEKLLIDRFYNIGDILPEEIFYIGIAMIIISILLIENIILPIHNALKKFYGWLSKSKT